MQRKLHENGAAHLTAVGIILILAIASFTGWRVWQAREDSRKSTDATSNNIDNSKVAKVSKKEVALPEGYAKYENKTVGFSLGYPNSWLATNQKDLQVKTETVDKYIFNNRGFDNPTYYDVAKKAWYDKPATEKRYMSQGNGVELETTIEGQTFYLMMGKGAMYCGSRYLLTVMNNTVVEVTIPEVCSDDTKSDPDPIWSSKTYLQSQFDKDLQQVLQTFQKS